jgi:hypothetical protein
MPQESSIRTVGYVFVNMGLYAEKSHITSY